MSQDGKFYVYRNATSGYPEYLTSLNQWSYAGDERVFFDTHEEAKEAVDKLKVDPVLGPPIISVW